MSDNQVVEAVLGAEGEKRELRRWLLLFVVWLGVIGPLYSLALNGFFAMRWQAMYPEAASYYASWNFWWFVAARECWRMVAALLMTVRRSASAVWFAILILWLTGPALVTGTWLQSGSVIMPGALIRSSAIAAAATLYLLRSPQVRSVYAFHLPNLDAVAALLGRKQTQY
jgi:hypothetical protein